MNAIVKNNDHSTNKILIDWFAMTTNIGDPEDIIKMLGMENIPFELTYGARGWHQRLYFDGISVHFDGHDGLVWLEMSGQGCRAFETFGHGDYNVLFDFVLGNPGDCNITRLDVAYDDYIGFLDLDKIVDDSLKGNFISKTHKGVLSTCLIEQGINKNVGRCVTHGTKRSSVIIRIYDKAAERNRSDEIPHWVRCEMMLRRERAFEFIKLLRPSEEYSWNEEENNYTPVREAESIDILYFLVLNHYLRYIEPSETDTNKWRAPLASHWEIFCTSVTEDSKSLYVKPGVEYNALNLSNYVSDRNAGPIYTYIKLFGINDLVDRVEQKAPNNLNPKYKMLLAEDAELKRKHIDVNSR